MFQRTRITSDAEAIARALKLTGFDPATVRLSAAPEQLSSSYIPFLWREVAGRSAWRVTIAGAPLTLRTASPDQRDRYPRRFTVILDEETGRLLELYSTFDGDAPDMRPLPAAQSAEHQLRSEEEIYTGFPDEDPKLSFLDALSVILTNGMGSPLLAKEFYGVCVTESNMGAPPRAVWAITLRGLPPLPVRGPAGDSVPAWQRNHMRNVLDALTGAFLFATNSPQPL